MYAAAFSEQFKQTVTGLQEERKQIDKVQQAMKDFAAAGAASVSLGNFAR